MTTDLTDFSKEICDDLGRDDEFGPVAFDPATLLVIIQIIVAVVRMLNECKKTPADGVKMARRPLAMIRPRLLAAVSASAPRAWRFGFHLKVAAAVRRACAELDPARASALFAAALSHK